MLKSGVLRMTTQLSKSYTLEDCQYSATAVALKIPNVMNTTQINNAKKLLNNIIESINSYYKIKTLFDRFFSCYVLNKKVGGSSTSEHLNANAADCYKFGSIPLKQVFNDIVDGKIKDAKGVPIKNYIDQMIFEVRISKDPKTGKTTVENWIHIGRRDVPRHQFETGINGVYKLISRL